MVQSRLAQRPQAQRAWRQQTDRAVQQAWAAMAELALLAWGLQRLAERQHCAKRRLLVVILLLGCLRLDGEAAGQVHR